MTAPLELRYRRLLAVYPVAHRRAYEEEMVAVLMAAAEPGQRRPDLREAANLLWSGLAARLGLGVRELRSAGWRDAAAMAGLISAVLLAAVACRRLVLGLQYLQRYGDPMRSFGVDGGLLIDVAARSAAWVAVLVAMLLAARRTAVGLAVIALLVEVAAIVVWLPGQESRVIRMSWAPILALLTVALLALSRRGRPATAVVRRRGLQRVPVATRRRLLVLVAPVLAVPVAQRWLEQAVAITLAPTVTPGMVGVDVLMMVGIPLLAFALAVAVLHLQENGGVSLTA